MIRLTVEVTLKVSRVAEIMEGALSFRRNPSEMRKEEGRCGARSDQGLHHDH